MAENSTDDGDPGDSSGKRALILTGALEAFAEKGFYNTKVAEIAQRAGVADGTIYLYFEDKDDLLISLFEDRMEWVIDRLESELAEVEGGVERRLRRFVELHFQLAVENPHLAEFITVELRQSAKFIKEYDNPKFGDYLGILKGLIDRGQSEGRFDDRLDSRLMARSIFGALDEVLLEFTLKADIPDEVEEEADQVADMVVDGLQG